MPAVRNHVRQSCHASAASGRSHWSRFRDCFATMALRWRRGWLGRRPVHFRDFEIESVTQILALFEDILEEGAIGLVPHHWLDQVDLVHGHELQYLCAWLAGGIARQRMD